MILIKKIIEDFPNNRAKWNAARSNKTRKQSSAEAAAHEQEESLSSPSFSLKLM